MIEAVLTKSENPKKKYKVVIYDNIKDKKKTLHFGAKGYEDYTIHKDVERKNKYIDRHKSREDWQDPFTSGFWALHTLWNKPSLQGSLNDIKKNFNIKIKNNS
jgi:hypothetical protein